ncbi:NAD(P)/FAD-dependent oxidoreductase [Nocardia sp. NPDC051030]|uniref:NAD(P)/FAD-dependent oxidoreductase n=1 Tax=Nocardia sp. NPDC051030 TaxID=3155162 RepID=UPI00341D515C
MRKTVAVVGGGPAGSSAAYWATRSGAQVVQFERSGPNRDKACGDALVKEAVPELREMGILDAGTIQGQVIGESSLEAADGTTWRKEHPGDCWLAPRKLLDQTLRDRAEDIGVDLRYRTTVLNAEPAADGGFLVKYRGPQGSSSLRADAVVLAHGVNCRLSQDLGIDGSPIRVPAVSRYQEGVPPAGLHFRFDPDKFGPGYIWEFPVSDNYLNVGIFSLDRTDLRVAMDRYAGAFDTETTKWRGAYEPLWTGAGRSWSVAGGGIISCGDAAGIVDPLTGEGIGPALATGRMAGQAAAEYAIGSPESARSYSDWLFDWAETKYDAERGRRAIRHQLNRTGLVSADRLEYSRH